MPKKKRIVQTTITSDLEVMCAELLSHMVYEREAFKVSATAFRVSMIVPYTTMLELKKQTKRPPDISEDSNEFYYHLFDNGYELVISSPIMSEEDKIDLLS